MYVPFYNLTKKPFQLNPDPEFFFNSVIHKRALAYLRYGLAQGEGFIVVTGMPGTGKTMLVKELFEEIKHENVVAGLMVTTHVDADDTLRIIAASFGLKHDGPKAIILKDLENFFRTKSNEGKRILLVVDEAQNLPRESMEELRMLSNFEQDGRPLFQSFMLGQEEFRQLIQHDAMEQVRQRVTATYHLRPFELAETKEYIFHRLTIAGWKNDPEFKDEVFTEIQRFSQGIPRRINTVCDRLMLYGFLEELHVIDGSVAKTVLREMEEDIPPAPKYGVKSNSEPMILSKSPGLPAATLSVANGPASTALEARIIELEKQVDKLTQNLQKERALLRKAILIQLDMDDVYDEPVD